MTSLEEKRPFRALVTIGLLYHNSPSKPGLDVAKILSYFFREIEIVSCPAFAFGSIAQSISRWLSREISILVKILKGRNKIKLIVIHQMVAVCGCFVGKLIGAKVMVYVGGSIYDGFRQKGSAKVVAMLSVILWNIQLKLADRILVPSKRLVNLSRLTIYKHKIRVAPTRFIKTQNFKEIKHTKESCKSRNIIGYVGRFEIEKGTEILPDVINFTTRAKRVSNLKWILIGDGTLRQRVEDAIKKLDLWKFVKVAGWVNNPETYLTKMRLLLLPSKSEGLPNVVLEAMACGTPVLATPVGAIQDIIKDGETGFLLESNDPKHIADKIIELLNKPELLERVSINAYNYVRENFSFEKTLESWRRILQEVCNR
jgi:glycosyltransferase involved in cell wall biosynthesis